MPFDIKVIDVPDFLDALEIDNISQATADEMRFSCPYPDHDSGDSRPSCYMNLHTALFFCQGCHRKGTAVTFAAYVLQISPIEATRLLKQRYQPGGINPDMRDMVGEIKKILEPSRPLIEQPHLPKEILDRFRFDWCDAFCEWSQTHDPVLGYWFERGFEPEWCIDWEFGYDSYSDRLTITVRDEEGRLIGFKALDQPRNPRRDTGRRARQPLAELPQEREVHTRVLVEPATVLDLRIGRRDDPQEVVPAPQILGEQTQVPRLALLELLGHATHRPEVRLDAGDGQNPGLLARLNVVQRARERAVIGQRQSALTQLLGPIGVLLGSA